jgi:hypothetical protein
MPQHISRTFLTSRICEDCRAMQTERPEGWIPLVIRSARAILTMTAANGEHGPGPMHPLVHPSACWRTHDPLVPGRWRGATSQTADVPLQAASEQPAAAKTQAGIRCLTRPSLPGRSC